MDFNLSIPASVAEQHDADCAPRHDEEHTERRLIERARSDPAAFAHLYRLHAAAIANYLYRRTGDAHVTEDLLSETFLAAMKALPRFRFNGTPLRFWLYRVASNAANRWVRSQSRATKREQRVAIARDSAASTPVANDCMTVATAAMQSLSPKLQTVLALHVIEELTVEQIAIALDCSAGTVKSRLFRAREALRHELRRRGATQLHSETKGIAT